MTTCQVCRAAIYTTLVWLTCSRLALAQGNTELTTAGAVPLVAERGTKQLHAFRITGEAPKIDGRFDEEPWQLAEKIDDFVQQEPENMAQAGERTIVQVAYDDRYLYVAARCLVHDRALVSAGLGRRGSIPSSDKIGIGLDPRHDRLTGYYFIANASGVQSDLSYFNDTREDADYEAVWDVGTTISAEGWTAEFRIPFSQIRFTVPDGERSVWGFQVRRDIRETGEWDLWKATPRGTQGLVSQFGELIFEDRLSPPRRVELLPFALARSEHQADGFAAHGLDAGADLRVGLGTSATLSATINPDFGQVELDPAVLNLSVFETFYPEKRPFFLEDSRVLLPQYGQFTIFHSRRIGRTPGRLELPDSDTIVHRPDQTTIIGAAKLTGKASGWTFGGLTALTAREYATVDTKTTDADGHEATTRSTKLIEPLTMFGVGRLQRDLLNGTSNIGAIATSVVRERDVDAFTGGPDYNIRWHKNLYRFSGQWVMTYAPIDGVKRVGVGGTTNLDYAGKRWGFETHYDHFDERFRINDLGFFFARPNKTWAYGGLRLSQPDPWKFVRKADAFFYANNQWTGDGLTIWRNVNWWSGVTLRNYWFLSYGGGHDYHAFDDLDTRGGPPIVKPALDWFNFSVNTDSRKRWGVSLFGQGNRGAAGSWSRNTTINLRLQPSGRLQTTISANTTNALDIAQWIDNVDADGDGVEDNVYGTLRRHVVNLTARGTYAFSRDLTLDLFLQPFVAVGRYRDIRKLARAKSFDFTPVTIDDDPNFNRKSLRGNLVLRWEYLRGSTLFVVWNLSATDTTRPGEYSPLRDLRTAFGARGDQVFVVKMNYWLTP